MAAGAAAQFGGLARRVLVARSVPVSSRTAGGPASVDVRRAVRLIETGLRSFALALPAGTVTA